MYFEKEKFVEESSSFEKKDFNKDGGCCFMEQPAVCEMPQERVCHRYFNYEVPHVVPCHTRIINHHIYHHSYVPQYTCCEENECSNVYDCKNNFF